jgi:hypothetical protein
MIPTKLYGLMGGNRLGCFPVTCPNFDIQVRARKSCPLSRSADQPKASSAIRELR